MNWSWKTCGTVLLEGAARKFQEKDVFHEDDKMSDSQIFNSIGAGIQSNSGSVKHGTQYILDVGRAIE